MIKKNIVKEVIPGLFVAEELWGLHPTKFNEPSPHYGIKSKRKKIKLHSEIFGEFKMEETTTLRGFDLSKFKDRNGVECSLQKSSLATEDCIWLGCNDADPKVLVPGKGWQPIEMPEEYLTNTRMHLTQENVKELLPYLKRFVDTGDIF